MPTRKMAKKTRKESTAPYVPPDSGRAARGRHDMREYRGGAATATTVPQKERPKPAYPGPSVGPDSGASGSNPAYPVWEDYRRVYRPTTGATHTTQPPLKPLPKTPPPPPLQRRPLGLTPPASTGPIISPQREVAARTASAYNYTDVARQRLAQTPIQWGNANPEEGGNFYHPDTGVVELFPMKPNTYHLPAAAHEFSHERWFNQLGAENPQSQMEFMADTRGLAAQGVPFANNALEGWRTWHEANPDFFGQSADKPIPTEIHAGIAGDVQNAAEMPNWYRNKWYPDVQNLDRVQWRPMAPPQNFTPIARTPTAWTPVSDRLRQYEWERNAGLIPDENGYYG